MFSLIGSAFQTIAIAVVVVLALAWSYPLEALGVLALVVWIGRRELQKERVRVLGLDLSAMSPIEYEEHCAELLRSAGWSVRRVGGLGDQGVDVIAELRGTRAAIQCKKYSRAAGNDAVQQVVAGKRHYGASIAVVVCPVGYTRPAQQLADSNGVLLLSERTLPELARLARVP